MKALICSLIVLCSVTISTVFVAICSDKLLSDLNNCVETNLSEENSNIDEIKSDCNRLKPFLILFMCDKDVEQLEMYMEDAINAARSNDINELIAAKSRLQLHIEQLRRQSVFSIGAIF
jgi:hypothetical protein